MAFVSSSYNKQVGGTIKYIVLGWSIIFISYHSICFPLPSKQRYILLGRWGIFPRSRALIISAEGAYGLLLIYGCWLPLRKPPVRTTCCYSVVYQKNWKRFSVTPYFDDPPSLQIANSFWMNLKTRRIRSRYSRYCMTVWGADDDPVISSLNTSNRVTRSQAFHFVNGSSFFFEMRMMCWFLFFNELKWPTKESSKTIIGGKCRVIGLWLRTWKRTSTTWVSARICFASPLSLRLCQELITVDLHNTHTSSFLPTSRYTINTNIIVSLDLCLMSDEPTVAKNFNLHKIRTYTVRYMNMRVGGSGINQLRPTLICQ